MTLYKVIKDPFIEEKYAQNAVRLLILHLYPP
jgi:hypothetical protein